jgi:hypothetical protein
MNKFNELLIGGGGIALVDTTPQILNAMPIDAPSIVQVLVQLVIGIVTLISLFKRKKAVQP